MTSYILKDARQLCSAATLANVCQSSNAVSHIDSLLKTRKWCVLYKPLIKYELMNDIMSFGH